MRMLAVAAWAPLPVISMGAAADVASIFLREIFIDRPSTGSALRGGLSHTSATLPTLASQIGMTRVPPARPFFPEQREGPDAHDPVFPRKTVLFCAFWRRFSAFFTGHSLAIRTLGRGADFVRTEVHKKFGAGVMTAGV